MLVELSRYVYVYTYVYVHVLYNIPTYFRTFVRKYESTFEGNVYVWISAIGIFFHALATKWSAETRNRVSRFALTETASLEFS